MRRKADTFMPIELAILDAAIAMRNGGDNEFHGYAIAKEIRDHAEARRLTAHGTLYRALERLETRGLLESRMEDPDFAFAENRPRRRLYTVTATGVRAAQTAERPGSALQATPGTTPGVAPS